MSELKNKWRPKIHLRFIECVTEEPKKKKFLDFFRKETPVEVIDDEYKMNVTIDRKNFIRLTNFMGEHDDFRLIPVKKEVEN